MKATQIDPKLFFDQYWRKKPMIMRGFFSEFEDPLSAEELAGLACEETVESRILLGEENGRSWQQQSGPFSEESFNQLPEETWSLLVQGVDHWFEAVARLADPFRFVHAALFDDVMASFSPPKGSSGPHFDWYDVFIVQGQGKRRWQTGQMCDAGSEIQADLPIRLLKEFTVVNDWILEPGDVLYIPMGLAHCVTSLEDSLSYSIGFRSPTMSQALIRLTDDIADKLMESNRLEPSIALTQNPFRITPSALVDIRAQMTSLFSDDQILLKWYGEFSTEPKTDTVVPTVDEELTSDDLYDQLIRCQNRLARNEGSKFLWAKLSGSHYLFVDGHSIAYHKRDQLLVELLCDLQKKLDNGMSHLDRDSSGWLILTQLINAGSVYIDPDQ